MIKLAETKQTLNVSSTKLFAYVANMENYKFWFPEVIEVTSANNQAWNSVGKKYREILKFPEGNAELVIEVVEIEQNKYFKTEGDLTPLLPRMEMQFSEFGENSTEFTLSYFSRTEPGTLPADVIATIQLDLASRSLQAINNLSTLLS